eukprot:8941376-Ditylum_brightwellii.AAC.1
MPGAIKSRWLVDPGLNAKLKMACADFVHALGLAFSTTEEHHFKRILDLAGQAPKLYKPPGHEKVRGSLLNANYDAHEKRATKQMQDQAEVFGLCFFGDGATIWRQPLMNILGACYQNPAVVLDIVDCTKHLETNGKQTGKYIVEMFCPHIERLDPKHVTTNLVYFDVASNVQSGGEVLLDLSKMAL